MLDSTKAKVQMNWEPVWEIKNTVNKTVNWYKNYIEKDIAITLEQIDNYTTDAVRNKKTWSN